MAVALWAVHAGAGYNAYAFAGKTPPKIDDRLHKIMHPEARRDNDVANVVFRMNEIAKRRGLPKPKARQP